VRNPLLIEPLNEKTVRIGKGLAKLSFDRIVRDHKVDLELVDGRRYARISLQIIKERFSEGHLTLGRFTELFPGEVMTLTTVTLKKEDGAHQAFFWIRII